jgi:hypothetical protein
MKTFFLFSILLFVNVSFGLRFASVQVVTNGNMSTAEIDSTGIDVNQLVNASFQAQFSGSPVGTMKLQFSDSLTYLCTDSRILWTDYTGSSTSISGAGTFAYNLLQAGYRCVRLVYLKTSGSGTLNVTFSGKGP